MKSTTDNEDLKTLIGASLSSEYLHQEQEHELMLADATDDSEWAGYAAFSAELEESAWANAKDVDGILIKKDCSHSTCSHFECSKSTRIGGIEV